jgi:hypothetical protein
MPRSRSGGVLAALLLCLAPALADASARVGGNQHCSEGGGRRTAGGGEKVSHKGWPAIDGLFCKAGGEPLHTAGSSGNDEILGHHGSDELSGMGGNDVLWGDWDPAGNKPGQHDVLRGGAGNDWIYPSHGATEVSAGPGNDHVWAFYGRGFIDCGAGDDTVRIRMGGAFRTRGCESVNHFCAHGSDGHGGCRKPGERSAAIGRSRAGA